MEETATMETITELNKLNQMLDTMVGQGGKEKAKVTISTDVEKDHQQMDTVGKQQGG